MVRGVGGWLLFLCISLTVLAPLAILSGLSIEMELAQQIKVQYPTFSTALMYASLFRLVLVYLSIRAGVLLWKKKIGAVSKAQTFLVTYAAYSLLLICLPYFGDLPLGPQETVRNAFGISAMRTMVYAIVWHLYLTRSVRVRNTFIA